MILNFQQHVLPFLSALHSSSFPFWVLHQVFGKKVGPCSRSVLPKSTFRWCYSDYCTFGIVNAENCSAAASSNCLFYPHALTLLNPLLFPNHHTSASHNSFNVCNFSMDKFFFISPLALPLLLLLLFTTGLASSSLRLSSIMYVRVEVCKTTRLLGFRWHERPSYQEKQRIMTE